MIIWRVCILCNPRFVGLQIKEFNENFLDVPIYHHNSSHMSSNMFSVFFQFQLGLDQSLQNRPWIWIVNLAHAQIRQTQIAHANSDVGCEQCEQCEHE